MKIAINMKISSIAKSFRTNYDLNIEIYIPKDKPNATTLLDIASLDKKNNDKFFDIRGNSKISDIEDMFFDKFGIDIQIKNKDGSITDSDLTIYKIINNVKGYSLVDEKQESNESNIKTKNLEIKTTKNIKHDAKESVDNEESEGNTKIHKASEVENRINNIDSLYIKYQKREKYSDMIKLLSSIEEAEISCLSSEKLLLHINSIMNKAHDISHLSVKKKKFFLLILSIIVLTIFITGVTIFTLDNINNRNIAKEIKLISNEIQSLKLEQSELKAEGNNIKASVIKVTIEEKTSQIDSVKLGIVDQSMNIFLIISFIGILTLAIMIVKLNKYTVTITRFSK